MKPFSSNHLINTSLAVIILTIAVIFIISFQEKNKIKDTNELVDHTQLVIQQIEKNLINALDLQASARGYVVTGKETYLKQFDNVKALLPASLKSLNTLIADNPEQLALFDSLTYYFDKRTAISKEMISLRQQNKIAEAIQIVAMGTEKKFTDNIRATCAAMEKIEYELLSRRKQANDHSIQNFDIILYCILAAVLVFSILLFYKVKQSFESQKASEKKFRALLDAAPDAMVITDSNGIIKMINQQAVALFGYTAGDLAGKSIEILMPSARFRNIQDKQDHISAPDTAGANEENEILAQKNDGAAFPAEISFSPIQTDEGKWISTAVRDITQRKKAKEQEDLLLGQVNQSNDAIFTVDKHLVITNWNYGAEKLYGFTKPEAVGCHALTLMKTELSVSEQASILEKVSREGYWTGEVRRVTKNNKRIYVITSLTAVKNSKGEISGYISVSYDISRQKELLQTVEHLADIVEHSSEAIVSRAPDKRIISWNEGAQKMLGYTKEEVLGKTARETGMLKFTEEEVKEIDIELSVKGKWQGEKVFYRKNGEPIAGAVSANAIKSSTGEITSDCFIIRDITLRKHMELFLKNANEKLEEKVRERTEELYKMQQRFKAMIENSDDLISVMDKDKKIVYRSPAAERITGMSNNEIDTLDTFKKLFYEEDFKKMEVYIRKAFENPGKPVFSPFRIFTKTGELKIMEGSVTNFLHDKNINAVIFNARDITERKKAEEQLIASEKRYREALDNMMEGIQLLDKDLRYIYVNEAVAKQAGQTREELTGSLITDLYPYVEQTPLYKNIMKCLKERIPLQLENEFVFPDKTSKYFQLSFQPVAEGLLIMSVDITDKKKAEDELMQSMHEKELLADKLSVILNRLPANIALLDSKGNIVEVNDGWKEFADANGYKGDNYGLGENYIETAQSAFGEEDEQYKKAASGIKAVLNNDQPEFEFEYDCHSPHGERWFRMIVSPLRHEAFSGAVVMHINITDLRRLEIERMKAQMEEQRNITRAMLQGQEKERNQIGRELHDNIVQLMAATKMKLSLFAVQYGESAPLLNQSIDHIQTALSETRNLSHQMVTPKFAADSFKSELQRLFSDYTNDTRAVKLNIPEDIETKINIPVKETLYRIAQEQLHNIDKYAFATLIELKLCIQNGNISMVIADNGTGFDMQQKKKGIGLTNIFNRAESYSGQARIITEPGKGCTLIIEIPLL
jgi:PAS domain S-box-containing protein